MEKKRSRRWLGMGTVAIINLILAALFVPLAVANLFVEPGESPVSFKLLYIALSFATPVLMAAVAIRLILGFLRRDRKEWLRAETLQRMLFLVLLLRSLALIGLSFVISNDSASATFTLLTGIIFLVPTLIAMICWGYLYCVRTGSSGDVELRQLRAK